MAQLKKLMINGIRSFDPKNSNNQLIEFYSPMTLIVGQNGCGKTTIIEALKFAITSEYPPGSSKGQSFVNDPKLSSGFEVPARVVLELEDKTGHKIVVTKRLKATQKGRTGTVSVTSIENTIRRVEKNGDKVDLSSKCMDVKNEVCRLMGVSEAILNNVIFCHQEDSCWPLTEGKKVKDKFDAIFNTTMYMKALDELVKKEKELKNTLAVAEAHFTTTTELMKEKKKKTNTIDTSTIEMASLSDLMSKQEKESKVVELKLAEYEQLDSKHAEMTEEVTRARTRINGFQESIADAENRIVEKIVGTKQELEKHLANFQLNTTQQEVKLKTMEGDLNKANVEYARLNTQRADYLIKEGAYRAAEDQNLQRLSTMKQNVSTVLSSLRKMKDNSQDSNFSSSVDAVLDTPSDEIAAEAVIKALGTALKAKETEYAKLQQSFSEKEMELQNKLSDLQKSKAEIDTEIRLKTCAMKENKSAIDKLRDTLDSLDGSGDVLMLLDDEEQRWSRVIDTIQNSNIVVKCEDDIQVFKEDIKKLEARNQKLQEEIKILSEDKSLADRISYINLDKLMKKAEVSNIVSRIEDQVRIVLGTFPENDLGSLLEKKVVSLAREVQEKENEVRKYQNELSKNEAEERQLSKDISEKQKNLDGWREQIEDALDGKDFEEACTLAAAKLDQAQQDTYYNDAAQFLFKKYIQKLKKRNPPCPLCKRGFTEAHESGALVSELEKEVEKLQSNGPTDKLKIETLKTQNQTLIKLRPRWEDIKTLESRMPSLKSRRSMLEESIRSAKEKIEECNDSLELLKSDISQGRALTKDAANYDQIAAQLKSLDVEIQNCERQRNPKAKECTQSLAELENEQDNIKGSISAKTLEKEAKESMRSKKRDELSHAQVKRNGVKEKKLKITSELQNREGFESQKKSLEDTNRGIQAAITEFEKKTPKLTRDIETLTRKKGEVTAEKENALRAVLTEKAELSSKRKEIQDTSDKIQDFEKTTKPGFIGLTKQFDQCKKQLDEYETVKKKLENNINLVRKDLSEQKIKKQNLEDNIFIIKKEQEIKELELELGTKEDTLKASKNRGAANERKELGAKWRSLIDNTNRLKGKREEIHKTLVTLRKEVSETPYSTLEADHCKNVAKRFVYANAQKDIKIYKTALDHAIMTFHHKKMETINKYLKFYWKKIYKGNDIDYIQIRTDNEDALDAVNTVKITAKKKVYNYRVVMCRVGIELDMRGRCSAGQKVLASIIIRMALAQTFSTKCGIITLDEPTTNLDERNIDSLAQTLSQLAVEMKQLKTFQLIIITHDQDFIEKLLLGEPTDYYFKVSRDRQGFSQIDRIQRF